MRDRWWLILCAMFAFAPISPSNAQNTQADLIRDVNAVLVPRDEKRLGILIAFDRSLYVQCVNNHASRYWRCEAAGLEGQPWIANVLTVERQEKLIALGFKPETNFGNFVAIIPRTSSPASLARLIVRVLTGIYDADPANIIVRSAWIDAEGCPARVDARNDGGGSIVIPGWGSQAAASPECRIVSFADDLNQNNPRVATPGAPPSGAVDIVARYLAPIEAEIRRISDSKTSNQFWAMFEAGAAYVQCVYDVFGRRLYCEAAAADSGSRQLTRILTPERRKALQAAGFETPGKAKNYWRFYPSSQYEPRMVAAEILRLLRSAYGYEGAPAMRLITEASPDARPL